MPDFTCLDDHENLFAKVAQTLLQHISSTHCNFKSALGPSILLLCIRLADVQMNSFINYCAFGEVHTAKTSWLGGHFFRTWVRRVRARKPRRELRAVPSTFFAACSEASGVSIV